MSKDVICVEINMSKDVICVEINMSKDVISDQRVREAYDMMA